MESDAQAAGSSPAPAVGSTQASLDALTGDQHAHWLSTGELPDAAPASSAAPVEAPPASTEASPAPASEPAPGQDKPKGAKARTAELDKDIAELNEKLRVRALLRDELARPPQSDAPAAPSPAAETKPAEHKRLASLPDAPKPESFESYEEYTAALALFMADKRYEEREQASQARQRQESLTREQETRAKAFNDRMAAAKQADPEFIERISPEVLNLKPFSALLPGEQPSGLNAIAEELLSSPVAPQLMRHFSDHPADLTRIARLEPRALLKAMGKLEADLERPSQPAAKTVTSAPPPPPTLGRDADPVDPVNAALNRGDFTAYRDEMNRREMGSRR